MAQAPQDLLSKLADRGEEQDDGDGNPCAVALGHLAHLVLAEILIDFANEAFGRIGRKRQVDPLIRMMGSAWSPLSPP